MPEFKSFKGNPEKSEEWLNELPQFTFVHVGQYEGQIYIIVAIE